MHLDAAPRIIEATAGRRNVALLLPPNLERLSPGSARLLLFLVAPRTRRALWRHCGLCSATVPLSLFSGAEPVGCRWTDQARPS